MIKRRPLIAANWKMNPPPAKFGASGSAFRATKDVDVVVFPTFIDLAECIASDLVTGAQCGHPEEKGAHTGDVSMTMLKEMGCEYVLCGHSERRREHRETDAQVASHVCGAINAGLKPILCIGETREEREAKEATEVVQRQLVAVLDMLAHSHLVERGALIIAYEPVWAIGNGKSATPKDVAQMHEFIRDLLPESIRETTVILYGGSTNAENAQSLLSQENVDGALVGGCSLHPDEFKKIVETAAHAGKQE